MKRLIATILSIFTILIFCLCGCATSNQSITVEEVNGYVKVTLDDFDGTEKIKIKKNNPGDASLYYCAIITEGGVTVHTDEGWLWPTRKFFTAVSGKEITNGMYVDSSTTELTIIIKANQTASGEIIFSLSGGPSPFDS